MLANLNDVLIPAKKNKYAVGLFNAVTTELAEGIFRAAEEMRAPIIVGTAEIFLPSLSLEATVDMLLPRAKRASVPVVLHYDHGLTYENCVKALQLGFSSIMYDCSTDTYEENIRKVAELVRIAHAMGATVEGELGHVGGNEGEDGANDPSAFFTDPSQAADYVNRTGVDALAIAVGNAHGAYKFPPKLDFARIETIAKAVSVPLVLHGGSGLSDDAFRTAIQIGIAKVNIFTDIDTAASQGSKQAISEGKNSALGIMPYQIKAVKHVVQNKMQLFGCCGKA